MEETELAPEVEGSEELEANEEVPESDGSIDEDFKVAFGALDEELEDDAEEEEEPDDAEETTSETVGRVFEQGREEQGEQKPEPQPTEDDGATPPARLNAQEKKIFSNIKSKTLRKSIQRMFKDHEAGQSKLIQDEKQKLAQAFLHHKNSLQKQYHEAAQQVHGIRQAVEPFLDKLTFNGRKPLHEGIGELAATHAKLSSEDPKVAVPELKRIAGYLSKRFQTTPEQIFSLVDTQSSETNSQVRAMQDQLKQLQSELYRVKAQPQIERVQAELNSVRQEKDEVGRLAYPELHDQNFLAQANPLVESILRNSPGISVGNAYKEAVRLRRGQSQAQYTPRPPAATTQTSVKPSGVQGSGSVRGKSAAPSGKVDIIKEAPKSGSIEDDWDYIRRTM